VPLSEREQRILEEIEKGLSREDPAFARAVRRAAPRSTERRRLKLGLATFAAGFAALFAFFGSGLVIWGVASFAAMVAGLTIAAGAGRSLIADARAGARDRVGRTLSGLEERLKRRHEQRGD
jgi:hypothetical protein